MRFFIIFILAVLPLLSGKVDFYSKKFLGTPYGFSPLGEGFGKDKDPRIRTDLFDCTTYVETVVAYSKNEKEPLQVLDRIRYRGKPDFYNRRHFPAFWLAGLIKEGYLQDASLSLYKNQSQSITKTLSQKTWEQRKPKFLEDFDTSQIPKGTYTLNYIPLHNLTKLKIEKPLLFSMVRENRPDKPIVITHQGFILPSKKGPIVRHARSKPVNKVVEEPLKNFIKRISGYRSWPVLGLNLAQIR